MKYRAKCTNWVEHFREMFPGTIIVTDPKGDYYAECDSEIVAESVELINRLKGLKL